MKELLDDYDVVQSEIRELLSKSRCNLVVAQPHYIHPSITTIVLPIEHPHGELKYYLDIRNTLEYALAYGSIPRNMLPDKAPQYLCDMVDDMEADKR